jgi:hypothetical protein
MGTGTRKSAAKRRFAPDRLADMLQGNSPRQAHTGKKSTSWTLQERSRVSAIWRHASSEIKSRIVTVLV